MSSTALEVRSESQAIYQWKSPTAIKQRIIAIQQLMEEVLKPGNRDNEFSGDYGVIPGTGNKPSLWKSGSEQILAMFEIAVDPIVEDLSNEDCFRYRVTTRLTHAPSATFLGAGVGEASSNETKYKWRKCYSQKEFEATAVDRRKIKYSQYRDGNGMWADKEEWLVRTEPADVANTILKMAKKRSQIDATLTVTGASSMFSQDLEELMEDQGDEPKPEKKAKPQASVKCSECKAEGGHLPNCSKRKNGKPAEVKRASDVRAPESKPEAKQEGPTICSECRQKDDHAKDCKFAPKAEEKPKALCSIKQVLQKTKKQTPEQLKKGVTGSPYLVLEVVDSQNRDGKLYVWDTKFHDYLIGVKDATLLCEVDAGKTNDGASFYSLTHIFELAGRKFVDDVPDKAVEEDGGIESLFDGE